MSSAVASIEHIRGESICWGLRSDPEYDGTETVTSEMKAPLNGSQVPASDAPVLESPTVTFIPAAGGEVAYWLFSLTASQTEALTEAAYITDARVVYASGAVDYPDPILIKLKGRVTGDGS